MKQRIAVNMMRIHPHNFRASRRYLAFAALICAACVSDPVQPPGPVSEARLRQHVEYLSDDRLGGRGPGTPGDEAAREYISQHFSALGAEPLFAGSFVQPFEAPEAAGGGMTANIGAIVRGTELPGEYIAVLAHHDGLGLCGEEGERDRICNGAVDNASGVAVLLELSRVLKERPAPRSVILLATGAEETGLVGARYFVKHPAVPLDTIVAAFGLDSVAARGATGSMAIIGAGLTNMDALVQQAAAKTGKGIETISEAQEFYDRSDHFAFAEAGVPALIVTGLFAPGANAFPYGSYARRRYHEAGDEADARIDYSGAAADGAVLLDLIRALGPDAPRPAWSNTAPYKPS